MPVERRCWRRKGARGLTHLKWVYWKKDPREEYIKKLGGTCSYGKCTLRPKQADDFIKHFNLVDLKPLEGIEPRYVGWSIQLVKCGTDTKEFFEARVDFKAALSAASRNPAVVRGLAAWLESRRREQHRWYQVTASSGDTLKGKRDRAILATFLFHGLRCDELCQLKVRDLHLRRGVLHLRVHGKGSKTRYIPAHPSALEKISDYLETAGHGEDQKGPRFRPERIIEDNMKAIAKKMVQAALPNWQGVRVDNLLTAMRQEPGLWGVRSSGRRGVAFVKQNARGFWDRVLGRSSTAAGVCAYWEDGTTSVFLPDDTVEWCILPFPNSP